MDWVKKTPYLINYAEKTFTQDRPLFGNCLKGCKWSPDGTCIATNSDDHRIRIFNLPSTCYSQTEDDSSAAQEIVPDLEFREAQIIYDYCWYPSMSSADPATCFLLCASRDVPIHLWDAYSGKISASYTALNNVYELVSSRSIQFTPDGSRIIAGYEKFICLFDISKPGNSGEYIYDVPNGIVSCIASGNKMFASGSFSKLIGLYDSTSLENIATLQGQQGGVTHLLISPDGNQLYSGARKDDEILCWDLRNYGTILHVVKRSCSTNQRFVYDINFEQSLLATGNDTGQVAIFDLQSEPQGDSKLLPSVCQFDSHQRCTNGIGCVSSLRFLHWANVNSN